MPARRPSPDPAATPELRAAAPAARRRPAATAPDALPGLPVRVHPPATWVCLDAVARAGSIRKAAERLHMASSALNRRVLQIEDELGTPVFERLAQGVRLTAAGEIFLGHVRQSLTGLEAAVSQIEQLRGLVRGEVRIAAAESVSLSLLPAAIGAFQARHPGVRFRLQLGGTQRLMADLLADQADLLLAHDPPEDEALQRLAELPQALCAVLRPDHPLAGRSGLRLADCAAWPVALGDESHGGRRLIDGLLQRSRLQLNVALVASSVQAMLAHTRETGVISFQFAVGTLREVARGEVVAVPLVDRALARNRLVLAVRRGRTLPIAALRFGRTLQDVLAAHRD